MKLPILIRKIAPLSLVALSLSVEASNAFVIESKSWNYKGHYIGYEEAKGSTDGVISPPKSIYNNENDKSGYASPILILNGFGVGSFHQHRLMPKLISIQNKNNSNDEDEQDKEAMRIVYAIDYLGQGRSWPIECNDGNSESEKGLTYSIDMWADQIIEFIESVIIPNQCKDHNADKSNIDDSTFNEERQDVKVHLIGNSVGGHLSAILAAKRPDLIESICLLNATPVWGLNLPGWNGELPPPLLPRKIGRYLFDKIRDIHTIEKYLDSAYYNRNAFDTELMQQIRGCTEGLGGHAAFASILWSPPTSQDKDFYSILTKVECDVLLIFGKNDPWCTPAFAKRMYQSLLQRKNKYKDDSDTKNAPVQRYIELDNVGHCPNHEAPQAVGFIASRWTTADINCRNIESLSLVNGDDVIFKEPWGDIVAREVHESDINLGFMDKIITSLV